MRICQVCGGEVDYDRRAALREAKAHHVWRVGTDGPYETSEPCDGSWKPTEEGAT